MNQAQAINYYIAHDHLTAEIPTLDRSRLLNYVEVEKIETDQILFTAGHIPKFFYFLVEGQIALTENISDSEALEEIIMPGQYFGYEGGAAKASYLKNAVVKDRVTLIKIPFNKVEEILKDHPSVNQKFNLELLSRFTALKVPSDLQTYQPIEVLNLPFQKLMGWLLTFILPVILYFMMKTTGIAVPVKIFSGSVCIALVMWCFRLLPNLIPAILLLTIFYTTTVAPSSVVMSGFSSDAFIMALCIYVLSSVVASSGLSYRGLLLTLKYLPSNQFWINFTLFIYGLFLSLAVPDIKRRNQILAPFLNDMAAFTYEGMGSKDHTRLVISGLAGTSVFSAIFLNGSMYNFILAGFLGSHDHERFQWGGWIQSACVTGIILFISYLTVIFFMCRRTPKVTINRQRIQQQHRVLGKMTQQESITLLSLIFFMIGFVTLDLHRMPAVTIALLMLIILLGFQVLSKKDFQEKINWPGLMLIASMIGVLAVYDNLDLAHKVASHFGWLSYYIKHNFFIFIVCWTAFISLLRFMIPIGPTIIISACILAAIAPKAEINIWLVGFISLIISQMWYFPYQNSAYIEFKKLMSGKLIFDEKRLLLFNVLTNVLLLLAIFFSTPYWSKIGLL